MNEEKLIEYVKEHEFLYNTHHKDYRDQQKRKEAWEEIGKKLNITWQECKDLWTKQRNAYTNAIKRRKTTSNRQGAKKISKWRFEEEMSFLAPYMEPRPSQSNFEELSITTTLMEPRLSQSKCQLANEIDSSADDAFSGDNTCGPTSEIVVCKEEIDVPRAASPLIPSPEEQSDVTQQPSPLRHKTHYRKNKMKKSTNTQMKSKLPATPQEINCAGDETEMFFLSLARSVKKLPQHDQILLKMNISNLVFQAELRNVVLEISPTPSPSLELSNSSAYSYANSGT